MSNQAFRLRDVGGRRMQVLTYVGKRRVEWRSEPEPRLDNPYQALVRPVVAARCDADSLPIFNRVTTPMRAGIALHYLDPISADLLGTPPYGAPFAIGHECVAEVVEVGEDVRSIRAGQLVVVPWSISCGACGNCGRGLTSRCSDAGNTLLSGYGFGEPLGGFGGLVSDLVRVPFADAMLLPVPDGVDPLKLASASDNMPDAWRSVAPPLQARPAAAVLIVGGAARSIGLYAAGMAVALGSSRVDYLDHHPERLVIAESLGANAVEIDRSARRLDQLSARSRREFEISVDASSRPAGVRYALSVLLPGGVCTAIGFYFKRRTGLPLMQMYANDTTLHVGLSHPRADLPAVLDFVGKGDFDPLKVATVVADWDDAPEAFTTDATKVVVRRPLPGGPNDS